MGQCRQTGHRLCRKQMEKKQWMSLQVFSCKPEVCRARGEEGGKKCSCAWLCGESRPGSRLGCRRQDVFARGWLALSVVCLGSHSCPLGSSVGGTSRASWEGSLSCLFQTTPAIIVSLAWKRVGLQAWEKCICPS